MNKICLFATPLLLLAFTTVQAQDGTPAVTSEERNLEPIGDPGALRYVPVPGGGAIRALEHAYEAAKDYVKEQEQRGAIERERERVTNIQKQN